MHVCVLCLEGTGLGMVIPEVPPGSTEPVPPELLGLGFRGACVGRRVCACLVRALVCTVGVFLLQTVPQDLRPGEGRGGQPRGLHRCFGGPSAHLAEVWVGVGHSATLWGRKVGFVASQGS